MKKILISLLVIFVLGACNQKKNADSDVTASTETDTISSQASRALPPGPDVNVKITDLMQDRSLEMHISGHGQWKTFIIAALLLNKLQKLD
jgi:hypothetical protein